MSDLINRADAIEALTKVPGVGRRAIEELSALPAAEDLPEGSHNGREYIAQDIVNAKGFIIGHHCREAVVRCKDCIHCEPYKTGADEDCTGLWCEKYQRDITSQDFCSRGVRRDE